MLQINVDLSDHEHDERVSNKKANKPLMEKKRRARINRCLYEMKQMLVESAKNGSASHSKWEKADILEMSVAYIKQLQAQTRKSEALPNSRFLEGYSECLKEVQKFNASTNSTLGVLEHNNKLCNHLNGTFMLLKRENQPKVDTFEEATRQRCMTGSEPSPSHSQTSTSGMSSGTLSPRETSPDASEQISEVTYNCLKKRRKSSGQSDNQVVPLPSTFRLPRPLPNRTTATVQETEPEPQPLTANLDPNLLARFFETSSQLLKYPPLSQWPMSTNTQYVGNCNDLLTINSIWNQSLWRPF